MQLIQGPAIIKRGGTSFYFRDGLKVDIRTETVPTPSDLHGEIGPAMKSRVTKISGRLTGMITAGLISAALPYGVGSIGTSIFGSSPTALVIWSKTQGQTISWARSAVSTPTTTLKLSATDTFWGNDIEFTCLGKADEAAATADHWQTIATQSFSDATFDETKILRLRYTAAYGSSPFDAMTSQDGFQVDIGVKYEPMMDDNFGLSDMIVSEVTATAKFKPSNLTEANVATLLKLQDTGALGVGEFVAKGTTDLVIAGTNGSTTVTVTLAKAGFHDAALLYAPGKFRTGEIAAATRLTWTTGTLNSLFTVALS
jgi:hypothetical protein